MVQHVYHQAFASDNYAGTCPEVWAALQQADQGLSPAYGADSWSTEACRKISDFFEAECDTYFVFNGTAANSLALASLCQSYHSVICHELAHVETDECGGPEFFSNGSKLLLAQGDHGRIDPEEIERLVHKRTDIHYPKPRVVSLTQSTELGTVYSPEQVTAIGATAREHGLHVHMDGARFVNALAHLDCHPADITWRAGVDVLCFGGTKQGMPVGEAVVFFDKKLGEEFAYRCKQAGQLASKMRYLAAPWCALLQDDCWRRYAQQANGCAQRLAQALSALPGIDLMAPCQANEVFVTLPAGVAQALRDRGWLFYSFIGLGGARFVCGWNCQQDWVDQLIADIQLCLSA